MKPTNPNSQFSPEDIEKESPANSIHRLLVAARQMGDMPWDSDPDETIEFLRQINAKHGMEIPINRGDVSVKLKKNDDKLKEMLHRNERDQESAKRRKRSSTSTSSPLSVLEPTTSYHSSSSSSGSENPAAVGGRGAPVLFFSRKLTASDMDDTQNRLSLPCGQVKSMIFFREEERRKLENDRSGVEVDILVPENNTRYRVSMKKTMIGNSGSYTINKPWNDIKKQNGFKKDMEFEIRGYRDEEDHICLLFRRIN